MTRTVICPYCQLPQPVEEGPREVYCENCGGPLQTGGPAAPPRPATVLWIDDDRLLLSLCAELLTRHGYRPLLATDGATGIATAHRERPDVILVDVVMPTMHGLEVCQQLRAAPALRETPIILLTALEDAGVDAMGKKVGATATLRKPFGPEHLLRFLETILDRRGSPPKL